jgi:tetratricopeptide (TPR) repeat protein
MVEYSMADLVCLHLQGVGGIEDEPVPREASTPGIAAAMDLGEETLSDRVTLLSTLSTLPEQGLVEERVAQVADYHEKRNVYALTDEGVDHARELRENLESSEIRVRTADTDEQVSLANIDRYIDDAEDPLVTALSRAEGGILVLDEEFDPDGGEFVDRTAELDRLRNIFGDALEGEPSTVFVSGEPGVGKTTLVRQLESTVEEHDGYALYGRCQSDVSEPYQPFLTAFADLPEEERLRSILTETRQSEADDRDELSAQRQAQFYRLATELVDVAEDRPIVLFIDDMQWADRSTALLFTSLARRIEDGRVVLVGACRPETSVGDWPLADALEELDEDEYEWLDIDRLDREWTGELVRQTVGALNVPEQFVDMLYERTDGNPLFVTESVARMLELNDIDPDVGVYPDTTGEMTIADEVERTIHSRLGILDERARDLLELGSVVGDTIPRRVIEGASDLDEAAFLDYAGILVGAGIWHWEDAQQRLYFESGVVRETVQDGIGEARWRELHERVADAYRQVDEAEHAAAIAYHERSAGNDDAALSYYRQAGEQATDVYAHEAAADAYERAVEIAREQEDTETLLELVEELGDISAVLDEPDEAIRQYEFVRERATETERRQRMRRKQAKLYVEIGRMEEAFDHLDGGLALADDAPPAETARLHGVYGHALTVQGDPDEALDRFDTALSAVGEIPDEETATEVRSRVLNGIGNAHRTKGEIDRAAEVFEELVELHRENDDEAELATVLSNYGATLSRAGESRRSVEVYQEARDLYEEIGDQRGVMAVLNNMGITYQYLDDHEQAIECFEEGLELARATENRRTLALLYVNLGYAYNNLAEFETAGEYAERARELGEDIGDPTTVVCTHEIQGTRYLYTGNPERALSVTREGLELAREADARNRIAGSLALVGDIHAERGEYEQAIEAFEEGIEQSIEFGNEQKAVVNRTGLVEVLAEQGDIEAARDHVEALEDVEGMAEYAIGALATFYREAGEYDAAAEHVDRGFEVLTDNANPLTEIDLQLERARLQAARGDTDAARADAKRARDRALDRGISLLVDEAEAVVDDLA